MITPLPGCPTRALAFGLRLPTSPPLTPETGRTGIQRVFRLSEAAMTPLLPAECRFSPTLLCANIPSFRQPRAHCRAALFGWGIVRQGLDNGGTPAVFGGGLRSHPSGVTYVAAPQPRSSSHRV